MHWKKAVEGSSAIGCTMTSPGRTCINFPIWDFAVPSWNRVIAMHRMTRMKCRKAVHRIVAEASMGRNPGELAYLHYENLARPNPKKKEELKKLGRSLKDERQKIKHFEKNGYEDIGITDRPDDWRDPVTILFHHYRKRSIDVDNLCTKSCVDALVHVGWLRNDDPSQVCEVRNQISITPLGNVVWVYIGTKRSADVDEFRP